MVDAAAPPPPGTLPSDNAGYLRQAYWEQRFETEDEYEWFRGYEHFRVLVERECKPDDRILVLGCGNSSMSEDMYRLSGLKNICSTDASPTVVAKMRERARASGCGAITWAVADMLALPYDAASFDVVIEKGSIDCFMVDNKDPWNPLPEVRARVATVLSEAHRVLTPHGCLLSITFAAPHFRKPLFNAGRFTWRVAYELFGVDWHYFFYTLRKGLKSEEEVEESAAPVEQEQPGESMLHTHMDEESYLLRTMLGSDDDHD